MISALLATMLLAAPSPDGVAAARREYSSCLSAFMKTALKEKMEPAAFDSAVATACTPKEQAFRASSVSFDVAVGTKRAAAEETATMDVQDMLANVKELYRDHLGPAPAAADAPAKTD
jgi:hypothetical protein